MSETPTESRVVVANEDDMMSAVELILLSAEHRFGRIADALETVATAATAGRNDITGLTAQVNRLADAFEAMAGVMACVTESVESDADGVTRCYVRTRDDNHGFFLGQRDERD
jgi:ABC-type transporter Mla subunit MlaD